MDLPFSHQRNRYFVWDLLPCLGWLAAGATRNAKMLRFAKCAAKKAKPWPQYAVLAGSAQAAGRRQI